MNEFEVTSDDLQDSSTINENSNIKINTIDYKLKMPLLVLNMNLTRKQLYFLCRRKTLKPSYFIHQGIDKKKGKLTPFIRRKYVESRDVIEFVVSDKSSVWGVDIDYNIHNVLRKNGTKDESWDINFFLDRIQDLIQQSSKYNLVRYTIRLDTDNHDDNEEDKNQQSKLTSRTITRNNSDTKMDTENNETDISIEEDLILEIKEMKDHVNHYYLQKCKLKKYDAFDMSLKEFMTTSKDLKMDEFCSFCRVGKLQKAKSLYEHYNAFIDIDGLVTDDSYCALQYSTCYGHLDIATWLINDLNASVSTKSSDGWNSLHIACKHGKVYQ
jgi:hypothetical protein